MSGKRMRLLIGFLKRANPEAGRAKITLREMVFGL
jgi:hypothetical protein